MTSQALLLTSLTSYFQRHAEHRHALYELVTGRSPLSLRVIDWFLTHYAKNKHIVYWIDDEGQTLHETFPPPPQGGPHLRKFHLYFEYRAQLKSYTKMYFDSFRRHERITFVLEREPQRTVDTTVGQLNLFRWALQNHVITYIQHHLTDIEEDMAHFQKRARHSTSGEKEPAAASQPTSASGVVRGPCYLRFD